MWEKITTVVLITTYTFCVLFIVCVLLEKILTVIRDKLQNMSSTTTFSPFQTPTIKNAKVVKLELNQFLQNIISHYTQPLPFENEPHTIETIPLIREHLDTNLFYIRYKVLTITTE